MKRRVLVVLGFNKGGISSFLARSGCGELRTGSALVASFEFRAFVRTIRERHDVQGKNHPRKHHNRQVTHAKNGRGGPVVLEGAPAWVVAGPHVLLLLVLLLRCC